MSARERLRAGRLDLALYLVTDPELTARRGLLETVAAAVRGGVSAVQLRDKGAASGELVAAARALLAILRPLGIPLLVNDDAEAARVSGADGVHVGQSDRGPRELRALLGPEALIGLSVVEARDVETVDPRLVDYVGLGPIFATGTKPDAGRALGEVGFREVRRQLALPVVAIGGLGPGTARRAILAGADGAAVVSAICAASDPEEAARALGAEVRAALAARSAATR